MDILSKLKSNKLVKSSLIYSVGMILIKGINFITFPIFSRIMSTGDFGISTVYATWIGFISIFGGFQLNASIATARVDFDEEKYNKLLSTIVSFVTITFTILIIISIFLKDTVAMFMGIDSNFVVLMTIQSFFATIISIYSTNLIQQKQDKKYLGISLFTTVLNISLSLILIWFMKENKYIAYILGGFIATTLCGAIIFFKYTKKKLYVDKECLKYALKLSIPIIPHMLSHQILSKIGTLVLNDKYGPTYVGIYNFALNIGLILQVLWTGINSAWVPWLFDNLKENKEKEILVASKIYIALFTLLTSLVMIFIPEISYILAPIEYRSSNYIIPLILLSYYFVFLYSFPVNLEFYNKNTKYIPVGTIGSSLINILLSVLFIPRYGLIAAAASMLISYLSLFIFHYIVVAKILNKNDLNKQYYLVGILVVFFAMLIFYVTQYNIVFRYSLLFVIILIAFIFRNRLKGILNK